MCSTFYPWISITKMASRYRIPAKSCVFAARKSNLKPDAPHSKSKSNIGRLKQVSAEMKRFGGFRHYLHSRVQSEQAAALKTRTLCRAVVCSHWLVIGR